MFDFEAEVRDGALVARIRGDATIDHARELQQKLLSAVHENCDIILDLNDVVEADISLMQIISAAHMLLLRRKRTITFCRNRVSPAVINAATRAGFFAHRRCSVDSGSNCVMHDMITVESDQRE